MARSWTAVGVGRPPPGLHTLRVMSVHSLRGSISEKWALPKVSAVSIVPTRAGSAAGPFPSLTAVTLPSYTEQCKPLLAIGEKGVVRTDRENLLSPQEAGDRLGVSVYTVRRWIQEGRIPAYKPGKEYRIRESDLEEFLQTREVRPKGTGRSPSEPSLFNGLEEERRLRYLRPWRAFVHGLARRWETEPPRTSREIAPLFEALTAVVEQGVFEPPDEVGTSEAHELMLLMVGFERLNEIANSVEQDKERNAVVRDIREKFSA
jgi:excisionase family DNA binding protein